MNDNHTKIARGLFGDEFLKHNDIKNGGCIRCEVHKLLPDSIATVATLTLEQAAHHELKDGEALVAKVFNGKGYAPAIYGFIPTKGFGISTKDYNEKMLEGSPKVEPFTILRGHKAEMKKEVLRLKRLSQNPSPDINQHAVKQALAMLIKMSDLMDNEDPKAWEIVYAAYFAGQWSRSTSSTEKQRELFKAGLAHTAQLRGKIKGSKGKPAAWKEYVLKVWEVTPDITKEDLIDKLITDGYAEEDGVKYILKGGTEKGVTLTSFGTALTRLKKK